MSVFNYFLNPEHFLNSTALTKSVEGTLQSNLTLTYACYHVI